MKLHLHHFHSNNPDLKVSDVIHGFKIGTPTDDIVEVYFQCKDEYLALDTNGWIHSTRYEGEAIGISPILYGELGNELTLDQYLKHPDYFRIELVVEFPLELQSGGVWVNAVTAAKHEYVITYTSGLQYSAMKDVELIVKENEDEIFYSIQDKYKQ